MFARAGYFAVFGMTFGLLGLDLVLRAVLIERNVADQMLREVEGGRRKEPDGEEDEADPLLRGSSSGSDSDASESLRKRPLKVKPHPFPTLLFLQTPRFLASLWGILVLAVMITVFDSVLPLYAHQTFDWGPLGAGLIFLTTCATSFFEPYFGHLSDKYGPRWLCVGSFVCNVPTYLLLRLIRYNTTGLKAFLAILLTLCGSCWSLGMTPLNAEFSQIVDEYEEVAPGIFGGKSALSQAFGLANVAFAIGSMVGPIWGGFMKETVGWGNMTSSIALLSAISVIPLVSLRYSFAPGYRVFTMANFFTSSSGPESPCPIQTDLLCPRPRKARQMDTARHDLVVKNRHHHHNSHGRNNNPLLPRVRHEVVRLLRRRRHLDGVLAAGDVGPALAPSHALGRPDERVAPL